MNERSVLCSYRPTKIIVVDDDPNFLGTFRRWFPQDWCYETFEKPSVALEYLNSKYGEGYSKDLSIRVAEELRDEEAAITLSVPDIHETLYDANRFDEVAVVVVDYAMPDMDGLEFCRKMANKRIKKLLLTAEAGLEMAVDAFNKHIIHSYLPKHKDKQPELNPLVETLQYDYFSDVSDYIIKTMNQTEWPLHLLRESFFIELFYEICKKHQIVEYYLIDNQGSFLLLDKKARPFWLAVQCEDKMCMFEWEAKNKDVTFKIPKLIEPLEARTHIPFFHPLYPYNVPIYLWPSLLHPAQSFQGLHERYYIAFIADEAALFYPLPYEEIRPYDAFLKAYQISRNRLDKSKDE